MAQPLLRQRAPHRTASAPDASVPTTLAVIAGQLAAAETVPALLEQVITVVPTVFGPVERAGIVTATTTGLAPAAATDDIARHLDGAQLDLAEGPTVDVTAGDGPTVLCCDLQAEERWPQWRAGVSPAQVGSCLSLRLDLGRKSVGALTLYAATTHAFTPEIVGVGTALALHVQVAAAAVTKRGNLRIALESRDVIGQAKGILMERHRYTADEAFDLLVAASQRTNRKLREVAEELTLTGELVLGPR